MLPQRGGEENQAKNKWPPPEKIAQRAQQEQADGIASLQKRRYLSGLFVRHIEVVGEELLEQLGDHIVVIGNEDARPAGHYLLISLAARFAAARTVKINHGDEKKVAQRI